MRRSTNDVGVGRAAIRALLCALALASSLPTAPLRAQETQRLSLSGGWAFALDPLKAGEAHGWHDPDPARLGAGWDSVTVPHAWPTDPRYQYTGTAWYQRAFEVPADWNGKHLRLAFGAVFYRAKVWVNGRYVSDHEGGYTPFAFDVTTLVRPGYVNTVAVAVDNSWDRTTLPGARLGETPAAQVYPWWNYGGLVREVYLLASPRLYVEKQKLLADPDLEQGTAELEATVWVSNATDRPTRATVGLEVRREGEAEVLRDWRRDVGLRATVEVPARGTLPVRLRTRLAREQVALWHPDRPNLYEARALVREGEAGEEAQHALHSTFGIRRVEVGDAQLLLNGEPIKMGGANRPSDHPVSGLTEPDSVVFQDLRLMKEAGMDLSRINHHATPVNLLEWADRNGMLIVAEAGNWQLSPGQMDDPAIRAGFQQQMREMVERDWNHPSVIGWSVGNEYASDVPAGLRWTRDMSDFVRTLDDSRLVTFVAHGNTTGPTDQPREERSYHWADLITVNLYSTPERLRDVLQRLHGWWPEKPIFITEFGQRADARRPEELVEYAHDFVDVLRQHPYVVGAAVWTFNDYRSRYPGTNPSGLRPWGVVEPDRTPRPIYLALRQEFAPATLELRSGWSDSGGVATRVKVSARNDFPRFTLRDYRVRHQVLDASGRVLHEESRAIDRLHPGESRELSFAAPAPATGAAEIRVELLRPTGFSVADAAVRLGDR